MTRFLRLVQLGSITTAFLLVAVLLGRLLVALYRPGSSTVDPVDADKLVGYTLVTVLLSGLLLVLCYVAGRLMPGKPTDSTVTDAPDPQSVMVYINGGWQPALLIERAVTDAYVVYVPHAPTAHSGAIYVVESFQITPLNMSASALQEAIQHFGKGLSGHTDTLFETP